MDFFRVFLKESIKASDKENLLHYAINPSMAAEIDPLPQQYLDSDPIPLMELPEGDYFITQLRKENLEEKELLELAIVLQKEALWNRNKLQDKLFLRQFFEDGFPVIQLWRPIIAPFQS